MTDADPSDRLGRPRFVQAQLRREPGARIRVRVVLEFAGQEQVAEEAGVGEEAMALRLVANATLAALTRAVGGDRRFEIVGVKQIHAFDEAVVLACVRTADLPGRKLLGSVPLGRRSLAEATVLAVLNATNRIVEWLPSPPESSEG